MVRKFVIIISIALFFTQCSQFTSIFSGGGTSSHKKASTSSTKVASVENTPIVLNSERDPITTKKGIYYFVGPGDTLAQIAEVYKINSEDLAQINNLFDSDLAVGRRLFIPHRRNRRDYLTVTKVIKDKKIARDRSKGTVHFVWPVKKFVMTSPFGMRRGRPHDGVDLSAKTGTPIYAAAEGKVIYTKRFSGYGNLIVIKHAHDYFTAYAHCHRIKTKTGKVVKRGQQIGTVGKTGRSTGPHLHFEVHKGVTAINPVKVLPKKKYKKW